MSESPDMRPIDDAAPLSKQRESASAVCVISLIIAATATAFAIHQNRGEYKSSQDVNAHTFHAHIAIGLITVALIASIIALIRSRQVRKSDVSASPETRESAPSPVTPREGWGEGQLNSSREGPHPNPLPEYQERGPERAKRHWHSHCSAAQDLLVTIAMAAALACQFIALLTLWPVGVDQPIPFYESAYHRQLYLCQTAAAGLFILLGFVNLPALRRWWFPGLLLFHGLIAFWMVQSAPRPRIDVWHFEQISAAALLQGKNPYDADAVQFPDIYNSTLPGHQSVYGEGMVRDNHLTFGFPYPPVSLYGSTVGYLLGDPRYGQVLALLAAGLLMGYCRPGRLPKLAAALFLFTPTVWFVLERAWTEPFVVMFLAGTIFCACRQRRIALPVVLGLLLASKQYLVLAIPLTFLLVPEFNWRSKSSWRAWAGLLIGAIATAAVVTLPLAMRDFQAFIHSLATVQMKAPFRWDALSYLVCICFDIHSKYQSWTFLWVAAVVPMLVLTLRKARPHPFGFATALAAVYLAFISFNKQAFCNYYFFVIGCFCAAIAAAPGFDVLPAAQTTKSPSDHV